MSESRVGEDGPYTDRAAELRANAAARQRRDDYLNAAVALRQRLLAVGLEPAAPGALPMDEANELWDPYLARLRDGHMTARRWNESAIDEVAEAIERDLAGVGVCYCVVPLAIGAVGVPIDLAKSPGAGRLVELAGDQYDLMLASLDASDGLCLERNTLGRKREFELLAWGRFSA